MSRPVVPTVRSTTVGLLVAGILLGITACGTVRPLPGGRAGDTITRGQVLSVPDSDAYTIIRRLRPRWLAARVQATPSDPRPVYPRVYVDHLPYGPIDFLNRISSTEIERIEFISAINATTLYGTGHMGGVVRVVTR